MPVVWQLTAVQLNKKILLFGVVLKYIPYSYRESSTRIENLLKISRSYFTRSFANKAICIQAENNTISVKTDKNGNFRLVSDKLNIDTIKIFLPGQGVPLKVVQRFPILFKDLPGPFNVISDIDDTIIISHADSIFKRIQTVLLNHPKKRKAINYSVKLLNEFDKMDARILYVSKSESNLYGMLSTFMEHHALPSGPLFLSPYLYITGLFSKKETSFKFDNIVFILKNTHDKPYILFGDDGQLDMNIYFDIAKLFPKRILRIYIRQTRNNPSAKQEKMLSRLLSAKVPVTYFKSDQDIDIPNEINQLNL